MKDDTPEKLFRMKLWEEHRKAPGMTVKVERMPQGSMKNYAVHYVSACNIIDVRNMESYIQGWLGDGEYLLRFVDDKRRPRDEFGSLWIRVAFELMDEFEAQKAEAEVELVKAYLEFQKLQIKAAPRAVAELMRACNLPRAGTSNEIMLMMAALAKADKGEDMAEHINQLAVTMSSQQRQLAEQRAAKRNQVTLDMMSDVIRTLQESGQQAIQPGISEPGGPDVPAQQELEQKPQASKTQSDPQFNPQARSAPRKFSLLQTSTNTAKDEDGAQESDKQDETGKS